MDLYIIQTWKKPTFFTVGILWLTTEKPQKKNMDGNWEFFPVIITHVST